MPKESKKFINPLLRPSQEAEVKVEPPARLPKSQVSDPPMVETVLAAREAESPPIEESSSQGEKNSKKEVLPVPRLTNTSTSTFTSTGNFASPSSSDSIQKEAIREEAKDVIVSQYRTPVVASSEPLLYNVTDDQRESSHFPSVSRETVVPGESLPPSSNGTVRESYSRPPSKKTSTYTSTPTDTSSFSQSASSLISSKSVTDQEQEEKQERPSFRAVETVRRKKGPLAFEKTHERITLWIDKGLKQGFEELALDRELPKTALLNEAVADLLRKYGI